MFVNLFFFFFWSGFLNFISQSLLKSSSLFSIFYFLLCPNCLLFIPLIILLLFLLSLDKKKQELAVWVIVIVPSAPFYFAPQLQLPSTSLLQSLLLEKKGLVQCSRKKIVETFFSLESPPKQRGFFSNSLLQQREYKLSFSTFSTY
jgi:hypothetical protein